jgi:hypothetical protein
MNESNGMRARQPAGANTYLSTLSTLSTFPTNMLIRKPYSPIIASLLCYSLSLKHRLRTDLLPNHNPTRTCSLLNYELSHQQQADRAGIFIVYK